MPDWLHLSALRGGRWEVLRKIQVPRPHSQKVHSVGPGEVWQSGYLKVPPLITMLTKLGLVTAGLVQAHPFTGKEMETQRRGGVGGVTWWESWVWRGALQTLTVLHPEKTAPLTVPSKLGSAFKKCS